MLTRRLALTGAPGRIPCTIAPMAVEVTAERQHAGRFHAIGVPPRPVRIADIVRTPPGGPSNG